jgi:hypothetical protein
MVAWQRLKQVLRFVCAYSLRRFRLGILVCSFLKTISAFYSEKRLYLFAIFADNTRSAHHTANLFAGLLPFRHSSRQ